MRLPNWPASIAWRLAILMGGLSVLTGLAAFTLACLEVRRSAVPAPVAEAHDGVIHLAHLRRGDAWTGRSYVCCSSRDTPANRFAISA